MSKMTLEENTELSEKILLPIIKVIDKASVEYDVDRMKETLKEMESQTGYVGAWPMEETMDKADNMKLVNAMYSHIVDMIEIRIKQKKLVSFQHKTTAGNEVLRQLGLM